MPHKDERGIWRHDTPQLVGATVVERTHRFVRRPRPADRCPFCGDHLESELLPTWDEDETNEALANDWAVSISPDNSDFNFIVTYAECDNEFCGRQFNLGREYYYNPTTNTYDLPRPLTRSEATIAEVEAERIASGQLALFEGIE